VSADAGARELLVFCDAIEEAGLPQLARRSRLVARDLLDALEQLAAERSARVALQERCERQQAILGGRADDAMRRFIESNSLTHTLLSQRGVSG
jgi:hypothetical protein